MLYNMWAPIANIILGLWLIFSTAVFHTSPGIDNNNYIVGTLVITFAVIALWDINRTLLKVNALAGAWLIIASLVISFSHLSVLLSDILVGITIIFLSLKKAQKAGEKYGGGWRSLFQKDPPHML